MQPDAPDPARARRFARLSRAAVVLIAVLAALPPVSPLLGLLACVPVLLVALVDEPREVWLTGGLATAGLLFAFAVDAGHVPQTAAGRALAGLALPASVALALLLQRRRLDALRLRDAADSTSEINRLLMSLLAHDLRAPLVLADQGFQYVEESVAGGYPVDGALVADVRARLQRSLRAIEMVLQLARADAAPGAAAEAGVDAVALREEIAGEIAAFAYEAERRGKRLVRELDALDARAYRLDLRVLRQALAIALDNAVRYAVPGEIRVRARLAPGGLLEVQVADAGPGLSAHRAQGGEGGGTGLGLRLCRALLARAGGSFEIARDAPDGTTLVIRLPARPAPAAVPGPASRPLPA